jgi:hypothetical protein
MNRFISLTAMTAVVGLFSLNVSAGTGNEAPPGPHYNLNIIGVENAKEPNMTGSNRHTIFVPLPTSGKGIRSTNNDVEIHTQIWLAPGDDFRVCDGNGFDEANGCADNPFWDSVWDVPLAECWDENEGWIECSFVSAKDGAVFELPCNNGISDDQEGFIGCDDALPQSTYSVWARALGSPKGEPSVTLTTCATVQDELQCSTENTVQTRIKGRRPFEDVTDALTSMVVDYCIAWDLDDNCIEWETTRIALFSGDTEDWFWNYVNRGVRLLQLRFYED